VCVWCEQTTWSQIPLQEVEECIWFTSFHMVCSELGIKNRKHAILWNFRVFALSAGLRGSLATTTLTFKSSAHTKTHIHHVCFLKMLLGVERSTKTHCLLRESGRCPCISTDFAVLLARETACWQLTMHCWATSMRLIFCWHTWGLIYSSRNNWSWCAHLCYHKPFQLQHEWL